MSEGRVAGIHVAPAGRAAMIAVARVEAVAGRGLEGDRYAEGTGTFSRSPGAGRQVTLIESEAVEAAGREYGVKVAPGDCRRNIVTAGVPLNHLVGREFAVGEVLLRGVRLCEPCGHMERLSEPGIREALVRRGGLRAEIVRGGTIRVGDPVREVQSPAKR